MNKKQLATEALDELETWLVLRTHEQTYKLSPEQIKKYLDSIREYIDPSKENLSLNNPKLQNMLHNHIITTKTYDTECDLAGSTSIQEFIDWAISENIPLDTCWFHSANKGDIVVRYREDNPTNSTIEENLLRLTSSICTTEAELQYLYLQQEELRGMLK